MLCILFLTVPVTFGPNTSIHLYCYCFDCLTSSSFDDSHSKNSVVYTWVCSCMTIKGVLLEDAQYSLMLQYIVHVEWIRTPPEIQVSQDWAVLYLKGSIYVYMYMIQNYLWNKNILVSSHSRNGCNRHTQKDVVLGCAMSALILYGRI